MSSPATPNSATPGPGEPAAASGAEMLRGRLMQRALKGLLDKVPGSREVLPYLAALETALGTGGAVAIDQIPPPYAAKVFSQLRVLPIPVDDPVLQDLVARVQRVVRRSAPSFEARPLAPFDPEATVVITEASHSDFMNALGDAAPGSAGPR